MKYEMEILPQSFVPNSNFFPGEISKSTKWTPAENKVFENALAVYDKDTPDRWGKIAAKIAGKTVGDVIRQYRELEEDISSIEAGLVPIPSYGTSPFTLEMVNNDGLEGLKFGCGPCGRKKGVPWTEEEHKQFLMGLKKYGKGDWRNISHNFVITRTPTQVASHAQKYFIRRLSGGKDKRRASIHDITTVDSQTALHDKKILPPQSQSTVLQPQPNSAAMAFNGSNGNLFSSAYGVDSFGPKKHNQSFHESGVHESYIRPQSMIFPLQS